MPTWALPAVLNVKEVTNLIETQAEAPSTLDEPEAVGCFFVVLAISSRAALRFGHQAEALVVAHGGRGEPYSTCEIGDGQGHEASVDLEAGFKVKPRPPKRQRSPESRYSQQSCGASTTSDRRLLVRVSSFMAIPDCLS